MPTTYTWHSNLPDPQQRLVELCAAADPWGEPQKDILMGFLSDPGPGAPRREHSAYCLSQAPGGLAIGLSRGHWKIGRGVDELVMGGNGELCATVVHELAHWADPRLYAAAGDNEGHQAHIHRDAFRRVESVMVARVEEAGLLVRTHWPKRPRRVPVTSQPLTPGPVEEAAPAGFWPDDHHVLDGLRAASLFDLADSHPSGFVDDGTEVHAGDRLQWPGSAVAWRVVNVTADGASSFLERAAPIRGSLWATASLAVRQAMAHGSSWTGGAPRAVCGLARPACEATKSEGA